MKKHLLSIGLLLVSLDCPASFNEGVAAYEKGDYQTALKAWKEVAEQKPSVSEDFKWHSSHSKSTSEAQYALGLLYWQGKGVTQDYHEAEKWLILAANGGHSEAQLKLAYLYLTGLNGSANVNEALKWFEQSAQQGNVNAQYNLGLLYFKGSNIPQDQKLAQKWLSAAAQQGDKSAKELLAKINIPATEETASAPIQTDPVEKTTRVAAKEPPAAILAAAPPVTESYTDPVVTRPDAPTTAIGDSYTIQLLASSKQNEVAQFIKKWRNNLNPLIMTDKVKNSERVFIAVYGSYGSTAEAAQAISNLPPELRKNKPWAIKMQAATQAKMLANKDQNTDTAQNSFAAKQQPADEINTAQAVSIPAPRNTPATPRVSVNEQPIVTASAASTNTDQAADPQPAPRSAEPTASLVGSTWHYVDEQWQYDIEFAADGVLLTTHPKDKTKDNDSWEQDGDQVNFYFNNKFSHFSGSVSGNNLMSGTATTKKGSTWAWKASRAN